MLQMKVEDLLFVVALVSLLGDGVCASVVCENCLWERHFGVVRSDEGTWSPKFYYSSTGPEKLSIEVLPVKESEFKENEEAQEVEVEDGTRERMDFVVDEDTIRKAEKNADKDLLNGLNRILKSNETLKDIFKAENVHRIP